MYNNYGDRMLVIGSHVSFNSNDQLLGSVKEALNYGANTFMFYTGAPQNTRRGTINLEKKEEAYKLMKEQGIDVNNVICHAPYIVNLANDLDPLKYDFSVSFLKQELKRCEELGIKYLVVHPGSSVGIERVQALNNIINGLNIILSSATSCMILLETMAGKGTECGVNLEEIQYLLKGIENQDKIGVCLDTCHLNDSGVDLTKFDEYLEDFAKMIGLDKIKCVHINDSKNVIGSHKDRHENIGFGTIGFASLIDIIYNDKLKEVPKILETPYIERHAPYKEEILMIKNKTFNPNLYSEVVNN